MNSPALLLLAALAAASVHAGPQDHLPPVPPWHGASEALIVAPDHPWITPAEKTGLTDTPNYDDTIAWLRKLAAASPALSLHEFGRTAQGRPLYAVLASRAPTRTPDGLRAHGRPTLLAQAGIHAGEIDGKDAGLMLLRDLTVGGKTALLDAANLLFIPALNADGHERISAWNRPNQRGPVHMGWRTTAQNLNLNRDYVKADAPEMRAVLALINAWSPSLYLDLHVTDGLDYQYDVTYTYHGTRDTLAHSPQIARWLDRTWHPAVAAALSAHGHLPLNLYIDPVDRRDFTRGLDTGHAPPRLSHGYGDVRHLPTVLVETHSLKPYRQRVLGTCVLLATALDVLGREAANVRAAIASDQSTRPAQVIVTWKPGGPRSEIDFLGIDSERYASPASGTTEVRWLGRPRLFPKLPVETDQPGLTVARPKAYWVPASSPDVIDRLRVHGVKVEPLAAARTLEVGMYRLVDPTPGNNGQPVERRHVVKTGVKLESRRETFPAGSVRVPTDQPLGGLAIAMLEPQADDSLVGWGFFDEVRQRTEYIEGYVIAPLAEEMLKQDPKLKAEFEARVAADEKFAKDPTARLQWFYARSKFYDERFLLYPVGIER